MCRRRRGAACRQASEGVNPVAVRPDFRYLPRLDTERREARGPAGVRVGLGDQRYGHGSFFSVVISWIASVPEDGAGDPDAGSFGRRASRARKAAATSAHAATATQSMNRASGSMNARWAAFPKASVATLYMPRGNTTLHRVGS